MTTAAGMVFAEFAAALERPVRRFPPQVPGGERNAQIRLVDAERPVSPMPRVVVAGLPDNTTATRSHPK